MASPKPDLDRLNKLLSYNEKTGALTWAAPRRKCAVGARVGWMLKDGRRRLRIDGRDYSSARIIWYLKTGEWLPEVDHKDCDPSRDQWSNLRKCTKQQNLLNRRTPKHNKLGVKGVQRHQNGYRVRICLNGIVKRALVYDLDEAKSLYQSWSQELHGEFGRVK